MFYDSNDIQLSTETKDVTVEDTAMKYEAWGWNVLNINGNDPDEIRAAIKEAQDEKERPTLIIGKRLWVKVHARQTVAAMKPTALHTVLLSVATLM